MSWHYACKKVNTGGDHYEYGLVEVYEIDGETSHTEDAVDVWGETPEDLAKWLRIAADDVDKYGVVEE